jgi:hypothetical protein
VCNLLTEMVAAPPFQRTAVLAAGATIVCSM